MAGGRRGEGRERGERRGEGREKGGREEKGRERGGEKGGRREGERRERREEGRERGHRPGIASITSCEGISMVVLPPSTCAGHIGRTRVDTGYITTMIAITTTNKIRLHQSTQFTLHMGCETLCQTLLYQKLQPSPAGKEDPGWYSLPLYVQLSGQSSVRQFQYECMYLYETKHMLQGREQAAAS